jgi:hypothetical protein
MGHWNDWNPWLIRNDVMEYFNKKVSRPSPYNRASIKLGGLWHDASYKYKLHQVPMDHSPINQNFDLNKSRQNSIIA